MTRKPSRLRNPLDPSVADLMADLRPEPPLHLLVCSMHGCASDMIAMITTERGDEPHRLCQSHYDRALGALRFFEQLDASERESADRKLFFDQLTPIEQWQLEGR
jgi:hypothetical protein